MSLTRWACTQPVSNGTTLAAPPPIRLEYTNGLSTQLHARCVAMAVTRAILMRQCAFPLSLIFLFSPFAVVWRCFKA
jgi:hypothetical protein